MSLPEKPLSKAELAETFVFFHDRALTPEDAREFSLSGNLPEGGTPFKLSPGGAFDLADISGAFTPVSDAGIVCGKIVAEAEEERYLGLGADWWLTGFLNGREIGTTEPDGNTGFPVSPYDQLYKIRLQKGINHIAVYLRPGAASWQFGCRLISSMADLPEDVDTRDLLLDRIRELKLLNGPLVHNVSTDRACISFSFNEPAAGGIRCNGREIWAWQYGSRLRKRVHRFEVEGLAPDTEYPFEVLMLDEAAPAERVVATGVLKTFPAHGTNFSFTLTSDTQFTHKDRIAVMKDLYRNCGLGKAEFFVSLGDVDSEFSNFQKVYFDTFFNPLKELGFDLPAQIVRGNHEYRGTDTDQYFHWFGSPYYAFRYGDVFFFVLDTGEDKGRIMNPHHYTLRTDTDQLFRDQRRFVEEMIRTEACRTAKYRVVLSHAGPLDCDVPKLKYYAERLEIAAGPLCGPDPVCKVHLWLGADIHSPFRYDPVTQRLTVAKGDEKRVVSENDKARVQCPVFINDGPDRCGEDVSLLRVDVMDDTFRLTCFGRAGNVMDQVVFTPGSAMITEQTTFIELKGKTEC